MSALMADHRDYADDGRQPSLFDVLAPQPAPSEAPEGGKVVEFPRRPETAPVAPLDPEDAWLTEIAPDIDEAELAALAPSTELQPEVDVTDGLRRARAAGSPLARPTLDDVMSRVWEGLAMALPAACPVCAGEVLPTRGSLGGSCTSCGSTLD